MDEIDIFLNLLLGVGPMIRKTYQQAFLAACNIDPLDTDINALKNELVRYNLNNVLSDGEHDIDQYLFLLMSQVVEPFLAHYNCPVAVYSFPITQASLAQITGDVASRFEVYYAGVELANGFHELTDAELQEQRLAQDAAERKLRDLPAMSPDPAFLTALKHGLPDCSGVAFGMDRLLAIAGGHTSIAKCMSFDYSRA